MIRKGKAFAYLMVIGSAVLFGISPTLIKSTYAYGGSGLQAILYSCLLVMPVFYLIGKRSGASFRVDRSQGIKLLILGLANSLTSVLLYSSYAYLPVGLSVTLHYTYPAAAALYLALLGRRGFTKLHLLALGLSILGTCCSGAAGFTASIDIRGVILAVMSGFTWGFYIVWMDHSGLKSTTPYVVHFYISACNVAVAFLMLVASKGFTLHAPLKIWGLIAVYACLHRIIAYVLFQLGIRGAGSLTASILSTFEPLVSLLMGVLILGETLGYMEWIAIALILSGVVSNTIADSRVEKKV